MPPSGGPRQRPDAAPAAASAKAVWRAWARLVRNSQPTAHLSGEVCERLATWEPFRAASTVLAYLAFGSEVDLTPLLEDAAKDVVVPRTRSSGTGPATALSLTLHDLRRSALQRHRYGMLEPADDAPECDAARVDVALVPGLCFDVSGTRLGYGRGYFDAFLGTLPPTTPVVGVTFDALVVPRLPSEPHDVRVGYLATESGVRRVS